MTFPISTLDDLLRVWRSMMDPAYARAIENEDDGRGFDVVVGQAAMLARVAEAIGITTQAYYLRPHSSQVAPEAAGAEYATGEVSITRAPPANGPITLEVGTQLVAMVHDVTGALIEASRYETTAEAVFAAGDVGPLTVPVKALRVGYQGNVPAGRTVAFVARGVASIPGSVTGANTLEDAVGLPDRFVPSFLGRYVRFAGGANATTFPRRITALTVAGDPSVASSVATVDGPALTLGAQTIEVEELTDLGLEIELTGALAGGRHGWLDAIGDERGCYRQNGESDADYLTRILAIADVVSPGAVVRLCERLLTLNGVPWRLVEAGDAVTVTAYQWSPSAPWSGAVAQRTIDFETSRRRFAILLGPTGAGDPGWFLDTALGITDSNHLDAGPGDGVACDGAPYAWLSILAALRQQLDQIRAGGVAALILIDPAYY